MSKTETAKALFKPWGHIFGGMSLILMSLFVLGWMLDTLTQTFGETTMPVLASLVPLLITLTGIAWAGYFIWKGVTTVGVSFDLFCKFADRVVLNKMSRKAKVLIGEPPLLAGGIILAIAMIKTIILSGFLDSGSTTPGIPASPLWPIGIGLFLFGLIVTHGIEPRRREQKSDET
jgi:hypothetical protein